MLAQSVSSSWCAYLHLSLQQQGFKTRLVPQKRFGPLTVQRPFYPEQSTCHVYVLHPPGGIVGGDELTLKVEAKPHSQALLTTPGATKFYRSAGAFAQFKQDIHIEASAQLEFLPLETIYFPGAKVQAQSTIHLEQDSELIFWETHCFGRPSNQESFTKGKARLKLNVYENKQLLLTDTQHIDAQELQRVTGMRGYAVMANMLLVSNHLSTELLQQMRDIKLASGHAGITQLSERLLIVRVINNSTRDVFAYFQSLWALARPLALNKASCPPRIWST